MHLWWQTCEQCLCHGVESSWWCIASYRDVCSVLLRHFINCFVELSLYTVHYGWAYNEPMHQHQGTKSTWSLYWTPPIIPSSIEEILQFATKRTFLSPGEIRLPRFHYQWFMRGWSLDHLWLAHEGRCKLTCDHPSAALSRDGAWNVDTCLICKSSVRILWGELIDTPIGSATSQTLLSTCQFHLCGRPFSKDWYSLLTWGNHSNVWSSYARLS